MPLIHKTFIFIDRLKLFLDYFNPLLAGSVPQGYGLEHTTQKIRVTCARHVTTTNIAYKVSY